MDTQFLQEIFELIMCSNDENLLFEKFLSLEKSCKDKHTLDFCQKQIKYAITNLKEKKQLQKKIEFYQALKNIAKIIETQYELKYILPVIGEMIDSLISEHLIYIFLKSSNKKEYKLAWPSKCLTPEIEQNLLKITPKAQVVITENTAVFPLVCAEKIIGAIVAHNHFEKLNSGEILMLNEISKQASLTISRAMENAKILKDATLDALTGLNNRRQFELRLKQEIATAMRQKSDLCAIMLDIDHFKSVNDTYGHAAGDTVLKAVSKIIKKEVREYDIPARYGGEEFSIILPHTVVKEAMLVAERLREKIQNKIIDISDSAEDKGGSAEKPSKKEISVTISVGVNSFDRAKNDPGSLYMDADKALYIAKESGRNRVIVFGE